MSSNNSYASFSENPPKPGTSSPADGSRFPSPPSPMEKVKTKLAVWSWARDQGLETIDAHPKWLPLLDADILPTTHSTASRSSRADDGPLVPNNSQHPSVTVSPTYSESGSGSPLLSGEGSTKAQGNIPRNSDDDDEDPPLELKARAGSSSHSSNPIFHSTPDYLAAPAHL